MKALIIAAGQGTRLNRKEKSKPLVPLLGLSLIERIILTTKQAGITEFIVVIGYLGKKIKRKLGNGKKYGVKIEYIMNSKWKKGNGISILKAQKTIKENFILLMSDHLFEHKILKKLLKVKLKRDECILCVDRNKRSYINLKDATKVKIENNKIKKIGKNLEVYNGIDCGIFLCSPSIFKALQKSIDKGKETLSNCIRILAKKDKMKTFDIGNSFWIDIDTNQNYEYAKNFLLKQLIKPTDGPISKALNRPVSIRMSKFLLKTNIKPNTITFVSFMVGVVSACFFSLGNYFNVFIGGLLAQFCSIIDGCDGEVARLKFQQSSYGAWFDAVLDRYADGLIILGMVYGQWMLNNNPIIWIVGFIALIGSFMNSYTADKCDSFLKKKLNKKGLKIRIGRDLRLFLIFVGALTNQIFYTLLILGILTNLESIRRLKVLKNE